MMHKKQQDIFGWYTRLDSCFAKIVLSPSYRLQKQNLSPWYCKKQVTKRKSFFYNKCTILCSRFTDVSYICSARCTTSYYRLYMQELWLAVHWRTRPSSTWRNFNKIYMDVIIFGSIIVSFFLGIPEDVFIVLLRRKNNVYITRWNP